MQQAAAHDLNGAPTFTQNEFKPRLKSIIEAQATGGFEAVLSWALGVSGRLAFRVQTFRGPGRLAIDVGHAVEAQERAGLPQTGERSPAYYRSRPVGISLPEMRAA